jgi:nucleoid DNA-binding protein
MNKTDLTRRLARATHTSDAQAADYLDQALLSILKRWKHGETAIWPGLGVFARNEPKTEPSPKTKEAS